MLDNIIDLAARRLRRSAPTPKAKVARSRNPPRFLHMSSKLPMGGVDTVELCIVSDEAGKKRRILSRITVSVDDLWKMMRALEAEKPFAVTPWIHDIKFDGR